jgi:hypothetical protein
MSAQTDISQFLKGLDEAERRIADAAAPRAVNNFSRHIIGEAAKLAPIDLGFLKSAATVEPPVMTGTMIQQVIGFNAVYAAVQHERLDFNHKQGQAKYLETPLMADQHRLPLFVIDEINKELGR